MKKRYIIPRIMAVRTNTESPILAGTGYYPGTGSSDNPGTGCSNKFIFYVEEIENELDAEE